MSLPVVQPHLEEEGVAELVLTTVSLAALHRIVGLSNIVIMKLL